MSISDVQVASTTPAADRGSEDDSCAREPPPGRIPQVASPSVQWGEEEPLLSSPVRTPVLVAVPKEELPDDLLGTDPHASGRYSAVVGNVLVSRTRADWTATWRKELRRGVLTDLDLVR